MLGTAIPVLCFGLHESADKGLPVLQMKGKMAPIEAYFNPQLWQNTEVPVRIRDAFGAQIWALVPGREL